MNTVENRIQYGFLTEEEKDCFIKDARERGEYDMHSKAMRSFTKCSETEDFDRDILYRLNLKKGMWVCIEGDSKYRYMFCRMCSNTEYDVCVDKMKPYQLPNAQILSSDYLTAVTNEELEMLEAFVKPEPSGEELVGKLLRSKLEKDCLFYCVKHNNGAYYDSLHSYYLDVELVPPEEILKMYEANKAVSG